MISFIWEHVGSIIMVLFALGVALVAGLFILMVWYENKTIKRLKIMQGETDQVQDDIHDDLSQKSVTFKPKPPVQVSELIHLNTVQGLVVNFITSEHGAIATHKAGVVSGNYRPFTGFIGTMPYIVFSTPSAAKTIFARWREIEKVNTLLFSPDMHKFMGVNVVFANGDDWKRQRTVMNPAFARIDRFTNIFVDKALSAVQIMKQRMDSKNEIEINALDFTQRLALDVLGSTIFGRNFNYLHELLPGFTENEESIKNKKALNSYNYIMDNIASPLRFLGGKIYASMPTEANKKMEEAIDSFNNFLAYMIDNCNENSVGSNGFEKTLLQMMVESVDEEGRGMTKVDLRNNVAVMILAGHETTASALSFAFYSLASNPRIQDRLLEEIHQTFGQGEALANYEKINNMVYLDCFLKENLRMFPPVPQLPLRDLVSPVVIDGYKVPKNFKVLLSIYSLHRHPEIWGSDAEEFKPERFLEHKYPSFSYAPFGGGPRQCVGKQFSLMEQKAFIIALVQNFKIELDYPGQVLKFLKGRPNMCPVPETKYRLVKRSEN